MGLKRTATTAVERILTNPLYYGFQHVKAWKHNPGGLYPLKNHEPIVDPTTWKLVNEKIKRGSKERKIYDDKIPLRGVLRCHCGKLLTGAASRGKMGKYYYYYKCSIASAHNNINSEKAHKQLSGALELMSLPEKLISSIKQKSEVEMEITLKEHKTLLKQHQIEYEQAGEKLMSIEEKWITNRIQHDTYERWHNELTTKKESLKEQIEKLRHNGDRTFSLLRDQLFYLSDLNYVYTEATTIEKQELIKMVFDDYLYYENGIYRTPYIMELFIHNVLKMREMGYLDYKKNGIIFQLSRQVELERFELSSSHGTVYAFYMFSFSLIVGRGKVSRLPIPYAVVAVSHKCLATSHLPVLLFDAPNVKPKNRI